MPRKLKVFRTPVGFHDAYVAAPSRKAALEAWGSGADLFARGVAEEVTDPALTKEPLAHPGEVIRLSRGDMATQLKAIGPREKPSKKPAAKSAKPAKSKPPPKRDKLDAAEGALDQARQRHAEEAAELERQRDEIERQLKALHAAQAKELEKLEAKREAASSAYHKALEAWSD